MLGRACAAILVLLVGSLVIRCEGRAYSRWNLSSPMCEGVVSFQLQVDTPVQTIETIVAKIYSYVPMWATRDCRVAIRSIECMSNYAVYASEGGTNFCANDCETWLQNCSTLVSALEGSSNVLAASGVTLLKSLCQGKDTSNCAVPDQAKLISRDYPICPSPAAVVPDEVSLRSASEDGSAIRYFSGTGCAFACPNPAFTPLEYRVRKALCLVLSIAAIIASSLCIRKHLKPLRLLVVLLASSCLGLSLAALTQVLLNWNDALHCQGNSAFINNPRSLCVLLSAVLYWFGICAITIAAIQAYDVWSVITKVTKKVRKGTPDAKWYIGISLVFPTLFIILALTSNQISSGGAYGLSIFCVLGYHLSPVGIFWFWTFFFVPACLLVLSCSIFFLLVLRYSYKLSGNLARHTDRLVAKRTAACFSTTCDGACMVYSLLKKLISQQKRAISFLVIYCGLVLTIFGLFFNIYYVHFHHYFLGMVAWIECLLGKTLYTTNSSAAYQICGVVPSFRLQPWMIGFIEVYFSSLGLVPALVFGMFTAPQTGRSSITLKGLMCGKRQAGPKPRRFSTLKIPKILIWQKITTQELNMADPNRTISSDTVPATPPARDSALAVNKRS